MSAEGYNGGEAMGGGGAAGVPTARAINTTAPLAGGGDLTADRTLILTFGSGLANSAGSLVNTLITGLAGGQTIKGGAAASETLTLTSTGNATKSVIYFGSAQTSAYDEVNDRLGIGIAAPTARGHFRGTGSSVIVQADATGASNAAAVRASSASSRHADLVAYGDSAGSTIFGVSRNGLVGVTAQSANFLVFGTIDNSDVIFGVFNTEAFRLSQASKTLQVGSVGNTANGTGTVTVGNLGPGTAALAIQSWWTVKDSAGNVRQIPLFG